MTRGYIDKTNLIRRFNYSHGQTLVESRVLKTKESASDYSKFDIFLSHSSVDRDIILAVFQLLTDAGFSVYVDWIIDKDLRLRTITKYNADIIRKRMKQCKRMVYIHTPNASASKWCPWEVGYFDAHNGNVSIAFVANSSHDSTGQEYLDLYPRLEVSSLASPNRLSFKKRMVGAENSEYLF